MSEIEIVDKFLDEVEYHKLLAWRDSLPAKSYMDHNKANLTFNFISHEMLPDFLDQKLTRYLRNYRVRLGYFVDRNSPFQLHCDTGPEREELPYKIVILSLDCPGDQGGLALYKQRGKRSFYFLDESISNFYDLDLKKSEHEPIFDDKSEKAKDILNMEFDSMSPEMWEEHFSHIKYEHIRHFSVEKIVKHQQNQIVIFDANRFHSSTCEAEKPYALTRRLVLFCDRGKDLLTGKESIPQPEI